MGAEDEEDEWGEEAAAAGVEERGEEALAPRVYTSTFCRPEAEILEAGREVGSVLGRVVGREGGRAARCPGDT